MNQLQDLAERGLSQSEAKSRFEFAGPNELPSSKPRSIFQQIWSVIKQPMLLLLLIAGIINLVIAEPIDGAILFVFVLVVVGISIMQEHKSETALNALRDLSAPQALVIRDGVEKRIPSRELVSGEVVVIAEGDRIPADGILLTGSIEADESALTGESISVRKVTAQVLATEMERPGGDATQWMFSGTLAVKGRGVMLVLATGANTEIGKIGTALKEIETEDTPLQKEISRLVKVIAVVAIAAALTVTVIYALTRGDWLVGFLAGIATAMAMLPEEYPVVLTVFLAIGAWRMSKVQVLARRSAVIETLGSASVVCVDKTGTITQNRMDIREFISHRLPENEVAIAAYFASSPQPYDPMDKAFRKHGDSIDSKLKSYRLVREYPLSQGLLAYSQVWDSGSGDYLVASKGAPEVIENLCRDDSLSVEVAKATVSGARVLGVARGSWPREQQLPESVQGFQLELVGLAALQDPIREGVPEAIGEAAAAGVRTVMITGDYPGTAMAIAKEIGLDVSGGILTGAELMKLSDAALVEKMRTVNVFARMIPEQKLQLIRALKANGEVVAMTGDGVNDSPALRAADIGIAMGQRGTDVAREAASLVLMDDNFTSIVSGIRQGRTIFENMRKALTYVVAVHIPILGMTLIPVVAGNLPLVLVPVLIAVTELIIDPACSIVFEAEAASKSVMQKPPRKLGTKLFETRVLARALLQGTASLVAVLAVYIFGLVSNFEGATVRSMAFITLIASNVFLILINRSSRLTAIEALLQQKNSTVKWVLSGTLIFILAITNIPFLQRLFTLGSLTLFEWFVALGAAVISLIGFDLAKVLGRRRQ